jgi:3-hydroxybutyryl-CoA dehydrogenase
MALIKKIGVVGAGVMGVGVSQALVQTGHQVVLVDISEQVLETAAKSIHQNLRFQSLFFGEDQPVDPEMGMQQISLTTNYDDLAEVAFVVENATEKWEIKKAVYLQLEQICSPDCIYAVNTSAIPIARIAALTAHPDKIIGMHFMNPAPMKPVVEVIRSPQTSDQTVATAMQLLSQMGKEGIIVNDSPGFVSNRVLMLMVNEAINLVHEGVAATEDVDAIFKQCFGHKMGPLETGDLIGLDTILYTLEVLLESFNDPKFIPSPLLEKMVAQGFYGRKSGQGFYEYPLMNY